MILNVPVDGLDETDLILLCELFDRQAANGPAPWQAAMRELADGFRCALAGRRLADARFHADPLGAIWFPHRIHGDNSD